MLKNLYKSGIEEDIEISIEKPINQTNQSPLDSTNVNPNDLLRNYQDIKILPINPQNKKKLEEIVQGIRHDLQHLKRIISGF